MDINQKIDLLKTKIGSKASFINIVNTKSLSTEDKKLLWQGTVEIRKQIPDISIIEQLCLMLCHDEIKKKQTNFDLLNVEDQVVEPEEITPQTDIQNSDINLAQDSLDETHLHDDADSKDLETTFVEIDINKTIDNQHSTKDEVSTQNDTSIEDKFYICSNCGYKQNKNSIYCNNCGSKYTEENYTTDENPDIANFVDSSNIKLLFQKYFIDTIKYRYKYFQGKSKRLEFWSFLISFFAILLGLIIVEIVTNNLFGKDSIFHLFSYLLLLIYTLSMLLPFAGLITRRLRDINLPVWTLLIALIPYIGGPILMLLAAVPSRSSNQDTDQ
jgi:uncharacterized membrane protein YhaH (DUF805 family)